MAEFSVSFIVFVLNAAMLEAAFSFDESLFNFKILLRNSLMCGYIFSCLWVSFKIKLFFNFMLS